MYFKKCEKTFEILRSEITFLMDLYAALNVISEKRFTVTLKKVSMTRNVSLTPFNNSCKASTFLWDIGKQ